MSLIVKEVPKKKVLIVAYYWPPAGGPGVQRWLKFVKYLPQFNICPIVFVPKNPHYPIIDDSLENEIPKEVKIIKFPIKEPYKLASLFSKKITNTISRGIINEDKKQSLIEKFLLAIRGNIFIPDARVAWVKPSTDFLKEYISNTNINTIITTGPPHSLHLIGLNLKQNLAVKWIADFRDPWTAIGYQNQLKLTKASKKKHKLLETKVLNGADDIIVTSRVTKSQFSEITNRPITVITNGYDDEIHDNFKLDSKFTLSHIGSFLSKRNPEILWKALSELIIENENFSKDFQLNLIGFVSKTVLNSIHKFNLTNYVNNIGYISHKESVKFQLKSQILLLIESNSEESKNIIPGKLFEYLVSNRPIIAIGPKFSDIENIIQDTNTGEYFYYQDYDLLKNAILKLYEIFKKGHLDINPKGLEKFHRKSLTKQLSKII